MLSPMLKKLFLVPQFLQSKLKLLNHVSETILNTAILQDTTTGSTEWMTSISKRIPCQLSNLMMELRLH
jgi:hypothetical protein